MFYRPGIDPHGLAHNPFKALVAPRPIGWISTLDSDGRANLAPYSFFNAVADTPPMVMYASTGRKLGRDEGKDTVANIRTTGEFVLQRGLLRPARPMNASSGPYPAGEDEFARAGLSKAASRVVAAAAGGRGPRGARMPALAHPGASGTGKLHGARRGCRNPYRRGRRFRRPG